MFFDEKTLYFLWYLLQFDLDESILEYEDPELADELVAAYKLLDTVIRQHINTQEDRPAWIRKRFLRQSGNHIQKIFQKVQKRVS